MKIENWNLNLYNSIYDIIGFEELLEDLNNFPKSERLGIDIKEMIEESLNDINHLKNELEKFLEKKKDFLI